MSFIKREIERISNALLTIPKPRNRDELFAAQQALVWASDPDGFKSPFDMLALKEQRKGPVQDVTCDAGYDFTHEDEASASVGPSTTVTTTYEYGDGCDAPPDQIVRQTVTTTYRS